MKLFLLWKTMVDGKNYGTYTMKITMVQYLELSNFDLGWKKYCRLPKNMKILFIMEKPKEVK